MTDIDMQSPPIIPIIDISSLVDGTDSTETVRLIGNACRNVGFFFIVGHGISEVLQLQLESLSHQFFALNLAEKRKIDMKFGGKAWRGYFAVGDEVTSGIPDQKEGIYFGTELSDDDPRYLHGANQWTTFGGDEALAERYRLCVCEYMKRMKHLGTVLMNAIMDSLHLPGGVSDSKDLFDNPTELFRIFNYPPHHPRFGETSYGVGEHTDYGYITILKQDMSGGLQVKRVHIAEDGTLTCDWIEAPPVANSFVINLGDALERMTGGLYRATPHRVQQRVGAANNRLSFPYFFDPNFDMQMTDVSQHLNAEDKEIALRNKELVAARWDSADPTQFAGTYGNYLLRKVSKVFPELAAGNLATV